VDPFQVRAEVRTPLAAVAVEENSGLAGGFWDCGEAPAHNPQMAPRQEAAARSREAAARSREAAARPPLASTYGHADQDSTLAGMRAAQLLREALQVHLDTIAIRPTMKADAAASSHQNHIRFGKLP